MRAAAALALVAALAAPAGAQLFAGESFDPALRFSTLDTPHFQVHFHTGEEALAQRAAKYLERAHELLSPLIGHVPREKVQVKLVDTDDGANGSAIPVPYDTIELLATLPDPRGQLNDFEDYLWNLCVHEYTHILHLDTIDGPSLIVNSIFGKLLSANAAWPRWFIEGWAVHVETSLSPGGRARSALVDGILRAQVLEGLAPDLAVLSTPPLTWPRRSSWYLYGGRFLRWLALRHGDEPLRAMSRSNAATLVPWMLGRISKEAIGRPFPELYAEFLEDLRARADATVQAIGEPTKSTRLTSTGEQRRSPRVSKDGRTLYSIVVDGEEQARVVALDLATGKERIVASVNSDGGLSVLPDGRLLVEQPEVWGQFYDFADAFTIAPETGRIERITHGARLSEPDAAADGGVVAVRRTGPGKTAIVLAPSVAALATGPSRIVHAPTAFAPVGSPRFSPDGRRVAFIEHRHGSFDLRLADLDRGVIEDLTNDGSQDLDPAFSEDGKRLLFSSDRSGVYDVYEIDLATRAVRRRTKEIGGAFEPLEVGGVLHYLRLGARGLDLAREEGGPAVEPAPDPVPAKRDTLALVRLRPDFEARPYSALDTGLPSYWLPVLGADGGGTTAGATVGGFDVLRRYEYSIGGWYGLGSSQPGFSASLRANTTYPAILASASRNVVQVPRAPKHYLEAQLGGRVAATFPLRRFWSSARVDLSYGFTNLSPTNLGELRPDGPPVPARGNLATAGATFAFVNSRRFAYDVSSAEGRRVSVDARWGSDWIGSDFRFASISASWAEFLSLPFLDHHVLALRFAGGYGAGDLGGRQVFSLGGVSAWNFADDVFALQSPTRLLRGFAPNAFSGNAYALGTAEYRFPIAQPELGYETFPFAIRRLHGAIFCDVGDAFPADRVAFAPHVGAGFELRAEVILGYTLATDFRIGYAHGFGDAGRDQLLLLAGTHF